MSTTTTDSDNHAKETVKTITLPHDVLIGSLEEYQQRADCIIELQDGTILTCGDSMRPVGSILRFKVDGTLVQKFETEEANFMAEIDADSFVSSHADGSIKVWSLSAGACVKRLETLKVDSRRGHFTQLLSITKDNDLFASFCEYEDRSIKLWSIKDAACIKSLNARQELTSMHEIINGTVLACGTTDETIIMWDLISTDFNYIRTIRLGEAVKEFVELQDHSLVANSKDCVTLWRKQSGTLEYALFKRISLPFLPSYSNLIGLTHMRNKSMFVVGYGCRLQGYTINGEPSFIVSSPVIKDLMSLVVLRDGTVLSGSLDGPILRWKVNT